MAHLTALELRPSVYAAQGYGSLFAYCTEALHLSEDAAWNRVEAARACRDYPIILDLLASGFLTLTAVRMLRNQCSWRPPRSIVFHVRLSRRWRRSAIGSSSRSARTPTTNCGVFRPCSAGKFQTEMRA